MNTKREWCAELGREIEVRDEAYTFVNDAPRKIGDDAEIYVDGEISYNAEGEWPKTRHVRLLRVNGKLRLVEIDRPGNKLITFDKPITKLIDKLINEPRPMIPIKRVIHAVRKRMYPKEHK